MLEENLSMKRKLNEGNWSKKSVLSTIWFEELEESIIQIKAEANADLMAKESMIDVLKA